MKIGILGGTFDPIHNGHLTAAHSVAVTFQTDEVHFVTAYRAPHKGPQSIASAFHRVAMVALATFPFSQFRNATIEVDQLQKRYTVETLQQMSELYPGAVLVFAMGTDMFQEIDTWKDYRRLFQLSNIAIVHRPGYPLRNDIVPVHELNEADRPEITSECRAYYLPFVQQPISSTDIRRDCRMGSDIHHQVPSSVWTYIERHKLYNA